MFKNMTNRYPIVYHVYCLLLANEHNELTDGADVKFWQDTFSSLHAHTINHATTMLRSVHTYVFTNQNKRNRDAKVGGQITVLAQQLQPCFACQNCHIENTDYLP